MKTINQKISKPFITVIIVMSFVIMLVFNTAMQFYSQRIAREELQKTVAGVELFMKNHVITDILGEIQDNAYKPLTLEKINILKSALGITKLSTNTEFIITSPSGEVLFPKSFENSFLNEKIVNRSLIQLNDKNTNEVIKFNIGRNKYIATYRKMNIRNRDINLVFISSANMAKGIIRTINLILFVIILISSIIASLVAIQVSKSISGPISRLSAHANKIGDGEFLKLENDHSSEEISNLTSSMNDMSDRLRNYDHTQKIFLQNASHELRTPLMSIGGYAEGIVKGVFSDAAKAAEIICEESSRLNSLVEELLTLSRIESSGFKTSLTNQNLCHLIKDYVQKSGGLAMKENKNIRLTCQNQDIFSPVDEGLLSHGVLNIISNCIKYAENNVDILIYKHQNKAIIKISDDGKGICNDDLPHIFERFYKGKKGNFGLGLAIAKSSIEYMNGSISVYNGEKGAVFQLALPLSNL